MSDRLHYDELVSSDSPIVRGTWVTAARVMELAEAGWTTFGILKLYPELNEDDIRACLVWAVEETT